MNYQWIQKIKLHSTLAACCVVSFSAKADFTTLQEIKEFITQQKTSGGIFKETKDPVNGMPVFSVPTGVDLNENFKKSQKNKEICLNLDSVDYSKELTAFLRGKLNAKTQDEFLEMISRKCKAYIHEDNVYNTVGYKLRKLTFRSLVYAFFPPRPYSIKKDSSKSEYADKIKLQEKVFSYLSPKNEKAFFKWVNQWIDQIPLLKTFSFQQEVCGSSTMPGNNMLNTVKKTCMALQNRRFNIS